jgi:hypothetical protein
LNGSVLALAVSGNDVYAAGTFNAAGDIPAQHLARWNGSSWSSLGMGTDGFVANLAVSDNALYALGDFASADGVPATSIARWDGNNWTALGSGLQRNGSTLSSGLAVIGNILYVSGPFITAGGKFSPAMAKAYLELPQLQSEKINSYLRLSWPTSFNAFELQQNEDPSNSNSWSYVKSLVATNGILKSVEVPISSNKYFFRLRD